MKKVLRWLMALSMLACMLPVGARAAAPATAPVTFDGMTLAAPARLDGQSVLLPVRAVCEALGYTVAWSTADGVQMVTLTKGDDTIVLDVSKQTVTKNNHTFFAGVVSGAGIQVLSGRTYIDSGLLGTIIPVNTHYDSVSVTLTRRLENNITVKTVKTADEKEFLKITIQYPQISGLDDNAVQTAINAAFKKLADQAVTEGEQNASDMQQAIKDGYTGSVNRCETVFDYLVMYNQNGLLSVVFYNYQYAGGAHGSTVQTSLTYDLATGKALAFADLMQSGADYTAFINAAIRREIDRRVAMGDLYEFDFSPFEDVGADPDYYLSNNGAVFYFQEYEYFPYAAGIQEFIVPYGDLSPYLSDALSFLYAPVTLRPGENTLAVGDIGRVSLTSNPSTGYSWHLAVSDESILAPAGEAYVPPANQNLVGAGGTEVWNVRALKHGKATLTFKYYRDWEGEASATADNTVVYSVTVK
ncbi:protease inhibitor I42 family protein [Oscillospiraceae bacterium WX1]